MTTTTQNKPTQPHSILYYSIPFRGGEWSRDYYPVALVAAADPHEVFRLTQVCNQLSEADEQLVHWISATARSSMVGDVVVNEFGVFRL